MMRVSHTPSFLRAAFDRLMAPCRKFWQRNNFDSYLRYRSHAKRADAVPGFGTTLKSFRGRQLEQESAVMAPQFLAQGCKCRHLPGVKRTMHFP